MLSLPPNIHDSQTSSPVLTSHFLILVCNYPCPSLFGYLLYVPKTYHVSNKLLELAFSSLNPLPELTSREWRSHHPAVQKRDLSLKCLLPPFTLSKLGTCLLILNALPVTSFSHSLRHPFPLAKWQTSLLIVLVSSIHGFPKLSIFKLQLQCSYKKFKWGYVSPCLKPLSLFLE